MNEKVKDVQRQLGFEGREVDGIWGKNSTARLLAAIEDGRIEITPPLVVIKRPEPRADTDIPAAGVAKLDGVHPALSAILIEAAKRSDVPFTVIEGVRSAARQAQLVKAGASKTQNSRHLTGHAADLWPLDANGKNLPSDAAFKRGSAEARAADAALWAGLRKIAATVKTVAREQGVLVEWGGDWGWDAPHFQLNRKAYPG